MPKDGKYTTYVESGDLLISLSSDVRTLDDVVNALREIFKLNPPERLGALTRIKYSGKRDSCYITTELILDKLGIPHP